MIQQISRTGTCQRLSALPVIPPPGLKEDGFILSGGGCTLPALNVGSNTPPLCHRTDGFAEAQQSRTKNTPPIMIR